MTETKRKVVDFRVTWEADHEQYWRGHGTAFTDWDESATGVGDTLREALDDALDSLAQYGIDVDSIMRPPCETPLTDLETQGMDIDGSIVEACCDENGEHKLMIECGTCEGTGTIDGDISAGTGLTPDRTCEECKGTGEYDSEDKSPDCAVCAGEWHFYVNVDVKLAE